MLKRVILSLSVLITGISLYAGPVAEVLLYDCRLDVRSENDVRLTVTERIKINDENGDKLSLFKCYTDKYRSLTSFSGRIEVNGKTASRLKMSDVKTFKGSESFADDSYVNYYKPSASYPYVIEYNYVLNLHKGVANYPTFLPVPAAQVPVKEARYIISVPENIEIQYLSNSEPEVASDKGVRSYTWSVKDFAGVEDEHNCPDIKELIPYVYASPVNFDYDGYKGSQSSWNDVGKWLYSIFPGKGGLPEELKTIVHELTDNCPDTVSKIRGLYGYLKDHTRYVSIQFGIGGYSPMPPSSVYSTGYGDCKALSFFLRQMLAEIGISSEYFIVNTDSKELLPGYSSIGQMNHAMLKVPLERDTLWVECTNPSYPLGFRHSGIAGHEVVIVNELGGHKELVPAYPDSLHRNAETVNVSLDGDGRCSVCVTRSSTLDNAVRFFDLEKLTQEVITRNLTAGLNCQAEDVRLIKVSSNEVEYDGTPGYYPRTDVNYSFRSSTMVRSSGDRLFLPVTVFNMKMIAQRSERKYDFVTKTGFTFVQDITFNIPEGYGVEYVPSDSVLNSKIADFSFKTTVEGNRLHVCLTLSVKPVRFPASSYGEYREFVKVFNKTSSSNIILKKA